MFGFGMRGVSVGLVLAMVVGVLVAPPVSARPYVPGGVQVEPVVRGHHGLVSASRAWGAGRLFKGGPVVWPGGSVADVVLPAGSGAEGVGGLVRAGGGPVSIGVANAGQSVGGVGRLRVEVFGRAAADVVGVDGLLLRLSRADGVAAAGSARVSVDYGAFRWAHGGDWASRLRLVVLPQCVLSSPGVTGCQARVLATVNDVAAGMASAVVDVDGQAVTGSGRGAAIGDEPASGTLVALVAADSGSGGDFKATSLSPSATWGAGGNAGNFTWSYPLRVPPAVGGPAPAIGLGYSSASVDGRMAAGNNQPSWLGEGFDWHPGFIERRYATCAEDMGAGASNTVKTGDLCWATDNATLSLDGHAGELIKDGVNANRWHLRSDDGTLIERRSGAPNGDADGEWWVATTTDGTQYWFGGRSDSNATLTVPVFGNHSDEPCRQAAFASSSCVQGYRWQLDHVVDPHGNTMSLRYVKETNKYGRNNAPSDDTVYDRDGYLEKIEYGTRGGGSGAAPMQVSFTVADRCLSSCGVKDAGHWPDVAWDLECVAATCAATQNAPTFWSTKRLSMVTTKVWGGSAYRDVESWTLTHTFPDPTDSVPGVLWLEKISHAGLIGGATSVPDVTFAGVLMPNRVDTNNDQYPAMNRYRIKTVNSETGGKLDLTYSAADCVKGTRMPSPTSLHDNALRCYPVKWTPAGSTGPINDFFHKYVITQVVEAEAELTGSSSRVVTGYEYVGDPAWHYTDDDGLITTANKTWSVWRGYGAVKTSKGDPGEQTLTETRYFRGMHGDQLPTGIRTVTLPAIAVGGVPQAYDEDAYAGMVRETVLYNGPGGAEVEATAAQTWQSAPTASRSINGTTVYARHSGVQAQHTRVALDDSRGSMTTTITTTFDSYGMAARLDDAGDDSKVGDEKCTLTDYVRNTGSWIIDKVSRVRTYAVGCATATTANLTDDDVIGDVKTSYDQSDWNVAPVRGLVSQTQTLKEFNSGSPTFVVEGKATHDVYGRVLESWDVRSAKTTTAYTPASGGPVTATVETSPLGWVKTTTLEPAWGLPLSTVDPNSRRIDMGYDGLGRLTAVWLPGRDKATWPSAPSIGYDYLIRNNAATVVSSRRLNPAGGYITSYQFYDNLLRSRQTQEPDAAGGTGAVITDTYYDSAGREVKTHEQYLTTAAPSTSLFTPTGNIPSLRVTQYDGAGRQSAIITKKDGPPASPGGTELWKTTTSYGGDRTHTTPPTGGTHTTTITNATGQTVELRQYQPGKPAGSPTGYDQTTYQYNRRAQLTGVKDGAGNTWTYTYDLRGRQVRVVDPDKGTISAAFNDAGDILSTADGRGVTLAYTYDAVGRKTSLRDGSPTGALRSEWVYDTLSNGTSVSGHLVRTVRWEGGDKYVKEHMGYTAGYRPTSVRYTVPNNATAAGVNGSYTYVYTYHPDGSPATTRLPAVGDLGLETLTHGYDALGRPSTLDTSLGVSLVASPGEASPGVARPGTEYTSFGELSAIHLRHNRGGLVDIGRTYDTHTRRLAQIWTTRATGPATVADVRFSYDPMGNVVKVSDLTAADHQCFSVDHLQRLAEAWTPGNSDCTVAPSATTLGGPAKYWHTYSYDTVGNRRQLVEHATATGDRTTTYTVPGGGHKLTGMSTVDSAGTRAAAYTYDLSGNMRTRPDATGGNQTLTWDPEGHLATNTDAAGTTTYLYDVDGNRLLRKDPTGTTLYLPGQELRHTTIGRSCTRYYTHAEQTIATRTAAGVVWLSGDHHGTAQISINAVDQTVSTRRETPFGQQRGATGNWPTAMDKGFVGGTKDNTGLTHLGSREYDPLIGRFISIDPVIDIHDPQQMHGYTYANNTPLTASDPDGLWPKFVTKAVSTISNAAHTANQQVASKVKAAGTWVYDNAGTISTVLSVAAIACTIIPPLQVAAPFLGAAAAAVGAIETYKTCKTGSGLSCAGSLAEMIPGGRTIGAAGKALKHADEAADLAKTRKAAAVGGCHSFAPTTPVLMADGTHKPIADIQLGDKVIATNPQTQQSQPQEVSYLHSNLDHDLTDLTIITDPDPATTGDETTHTINTTANHPFWNTTKNTWTNAGQLQPGDKLHDLNGMPVTVIATHDHTSQRWMNDLTINNTHTYHIIAGNTAILVHNNRPEACRKWHTLPDNVQPFGNSPTTGRAEYQAAEVKRRHEDYRESISAPARGVKAATQQGVSGSGLLILGALATRWAILTARWLRPKLPSLTSKVTAWRTGTRGIE